MRNLAVLCSLALAACASTPSEPHDALPTAPVRHYGEIRKIFAGSWDASTTLGEGAGGKHAYALGALSDLRGEFVVVDDEAWLAYPTDSALPRVMRDDASDEDAALLVVANVERWQEVPLDAAVPAAEVSQTIRALAEANGVDTAKPFPFLIRGGLANVAWHVVDGTKVEPGTRPDTSAQKGTLPVAEGTIVGFYSTEHEGIFIMMGQTTHMHVLTVDGSVTGHVQSVDLEAGAVLSLPD